MSTVLWILGAVVLLGILVIVHELGHYMAGRLLKLPVIEFAVGFGPALLKWTRKGIQYSLRALPLGGYCAYADEDIDGVKGFNEHPAWKRLIAFFAGPAMNLLIAYLLAVLLLSTAGLPYIGNKIASVSPGMPAEAVGIVAGDAILSVNGEESLSPSALIRQSTGEIELLLENEGQTRTVKLETVYDEKNNANLIGIMMQQDYYVFPVGESFTRGVSACYDMMAQMLTYLRELVVGKQDAGELVGIVGTVTLISSQAQQGFAQSLRSGLVTVLNLAIMISLNLGLINLLPIPAMDGGRIVFTFIEMVVGRPVPRKVEAIIHGVGIVLLFGLMGILLFKDIFGLITGTLPV